MSHSCWQQVEDPGEAGLIVVAYWCKCDASALQVGQADPQNLPLIPLYVRWLYNRAPMLCCGSRRAVVDWIARGGLYGNHTRIGGREGDITTT